MNVFNLNNYHDDLTIDALHLELVAARRRIAELEVQYEDAMHLCRAREELNRVWGRKVEESDKRVAKLVRMARTYLRTEEHHRHISDGETFARAILAGAKTERKCHEK